MVRNAPTSTTARRETGALLLSREGAVARERWFSSVAKATWVPASTPAPVVERRSGRLLGNGLRANRASSLDLPRFVVTEDVVALYPGAKAGRELTAT